MIECKKCSSKKEPLKSYNHSWYCLRCYNAIKKELYEHKIDPELQKTLDIIEKVDVTKMFGGND